MLSGCSSGVNLDRFRTDRSIVTGSVSNDTKMVDSSASDEAAIRATISAWSLEQAPLDAVPWVNGNTGSSGAITRISDSRDGGTRCRSFAASRETFGGSSFYNGKACSADGGPWIVKALEKG